ncbi:MAG: TM2 domain-containing protein [Muribaculaceae bacterium]|nr:TM2 domain-containing protein [Muribaculaceae bacterium]
MDYQTPRVPSGKSKVVAGVLALFLGGLGAHYFYCGKTKGGIIMLIVTLVLCGIPMILAFVQAIMFFVISQEEFDRKWVYSPSESIPFF